MARSAKIYDFAMAAGGSFTLLAEGGFYKIMQTLGDVEVIRDGGSRMGPINAGQGERDEFKRLTIVDKSGAANRGYIIVGDGSFIDDRVSGEVSVIDGGRSLVMAGRSFGGWGSQGASPGNYGHVQLWNPAGRAEHIALSKLMITSSAVSAVFQIRWINSALATLWANPNSKKFGSANSTAEIRQDIPATILGNGANFLASIPGNQTLQVDFKEPVIIVPGMGLIVTCTSVNVHVAASFDFYEFTP